MRVCVLWWKAFKWNGELIVLLDIPRHQSFLNFDGVEALKNGSNCKGFRVLPVLWMMRAAGMIDNVKYVCSTKYTQKTPHVVVFGNHPPPAAGNAWSADRVHEALCADG